MRILDVKKSTFLHSNVQRYYHTDKSEPYYKTDRVSEKTTL